MSDEQLRDMDREVAIRAAAMLANILSADPNIVGGGAVSDVVWVHAKDRTKQWRQHVATAIWYVEKRDNVTIKTETGEPMADAISKEQPKKPGEILCRFCKKNATPYGICDRCSPAYWAGRREPRSGRTHKGIIADSLGSLRRQIPVRRAALNRAVDAFEERLGGTTMTNCMVAATRSFSELIETYGDLQHVYARMEGPEMEPKQE